MSSHDETEGNISTVDPLNMGVRGADFPQSLKPKYKNSPHKVNSQNRLIADWQLSESFAELGENGEGIKKKKRHRQRYSRKKSSPPHTSILNWKTGPPAIHLNCASQLKEKKKKIHTFTWTWALGTHVVQGSTVPLQKKALKEPFQSFF